MRSVVLAVSIITSALTLLGQTDRLVMLLKEPTGNVARGVTIVRYVGRTDIQSKQSDSSGQIEWDNLPLGKVSFRIASAPFAARHFDILVRSGLQRETIELAADSPDIIPTTGGATILKAQP